MGDRHGRARVALTALCLGCLMVTGCSNDSSTPTSTTADPVLPGESAGDAFNRIYDGCMDESAQPYELVDADLNGVPAKLRAYDHKSPLYSAEADAKCMERATAVLEPPTKDELGRSYAATLKIVNCIRSDGFDIGVVVSEAEYINSGGAVSISSDWDAVASQSPPGFSESVDRCFAEFAPSVGG